LGEQYCEVGKLNVKKRANDLILNKKSQDKKWGITHYWASLRQEEQSILTEGGWDEGGFNDNGGVSKADALHDPLTYIEAAVLGGGFVRAGLRWLVATGEIQTGTNTVYQVVQNGRTVYVGITQNFKQRADYWSNARNWNIEPVRGLYENLSRYDARAVEQVLIEHYGLANLENQINSIAATNAIYQAAVQRGNEILQTIGFFGR
jgi:hypothetical protein